MLIILTIFKINTTFTLLKFHLIIQSQLIIIGPFYPITLNLKHYPPVMDFHQVCSPNSKINTFQGFRK